jgi:hypothetical protein
MICLVLQVLCKCLFFVKWLAFSVTRLWDTKISVRLDVREYFSVDGYQRFKRTCCFHLNYGIYSPTLWYIGICLSVCPEPYSTRLNLDTDRLRVLSRLWGTRLSSNMKLYARFRVLAAVSRRFRPERYNVASQKTRIPRNIFFLSTRLERFGINLESVEGSLPQSKATKAQSSLLCLLSRLRICGALLVCLWVRCYSTVMHWSCRDGRVRALGGGVNWILGAQVRDQLCSMMHRNETSVSIRWCKLLD